MSISARTVFLLRSGLLYLPSVLLLLALGYQSERAAWKEILSALTIMALCLFAGQFFVTPRNRHVAGPGKAKMLGTAHTALGYGGIAIAFLHPLFIVVPRYYDIGVEPLDALSTILTTFTSRGVVLGMIAWTLMIILGISSAFRRKLPVRHGTWRTIHGSTAILFMIAASWHAFDLGRHLAMPLSIALVLFTCSTPLILRNLNIHSTSTGDINETS